MKLEPRGLELLQNQMADDPALLKEALSLKLSIKGGVIKGNATEGRSPALGVAFEHQVARREAAVERHPNRSWIHDVPASNGAVHWQVGVSDDERRLDHAVEARFDLLFGCIGKNRFPRAAGRAMRHANWRRVRKAQTQRIGPGSDECPPPTVELTPQPRQQGKLRTIAPDRRGARRLVVEEIILVVASNYTPTGAGNEFDDLGGKWPPVDEIPRDDNLIDIELLEVLHDGFERWEVAVDVGEDGELGHL